MTKLNARGASALIFCVWVAGCGVMQRQAFREPEVIIDAAALAGGLDSQHFELDLNIYNPNHYRLDGSRIRYKALADSMEIASGVIERRVTLKPRDSVTVRVPVDVDARAVPALIMSFFMNRGSVSWQLIGDMRIETVFGSVTRSFEQRGTYNPLTKRVTIYRRK